MMTDSAFDARFEKLEERAAFQEQTIDELSKAVSEQWKLIEALKREVGRLTEEIKSVEDNILQGGAREPPPPHY